MVCIAALLTTQNLFISVHDAVLFAGRSIIESEMMPPAPSPAPCSSSSATQTTLPDEINGTHIPEAQTSEAAALAPNSLDMSSRGDGASEIEGYPSGDAWECDQ